LNLMKVLFAGTPEFAVAPLKALNKQHEIVAVFTQPDRKSGRGKKLTPPPVKLFAESINTPVHQPETLADQRDIIRSYNADVIVVVAYGMLLPQNILDIPPLGCINIHASLLPHWRGAAPIQRSIEAGDAKTGVSIMRMELGLDTGPVFQVLETPITEQDTSASLHNTLSELGAQGICQTLSTLTNNPEHRPHPQNDDLATYAKKINKQEATVDWAQDAKSIHRKLRAFIPWPGCQTEHNGSRLRIWQASIEAPENASELHTPAGSIIDISDQGPLIACGEGALRLEVLQRDGNRAMPFKACQENSILERLLHNLVGKS